MNDEKMPERLWCFKVSTDEGWKHVWTRGMPPTTAEARDYILVELYEKLMDRFHSVVETLDKADSKYIATQNERDAEKSYQGVMYERARVVKWLRSLGQRVLPDAIENGDHMVEERP